MSWIYLLIAGFFEICFTLMLKYSQGFSRLLPSGLAVLFILSSFYCFSQALRTIPIGTAYAVWAGIGAAGTALVGILFFGDSYPLLRILSLLAIVLGIIGLKFAHTSPF